MICPLLTAGPTKSPLLFCVARPDGAMLRLNDVVARVAPDWTGITARIDFN
jgi:hypothetical protein